MQANGVVMSSGWKRLLAAAAAAALVFCGLMYWYQWSARPLTRPEVDRYIARIEAQRQAPGGRIDLVALRRFLEADDGRPFYTVNLYRFHDKAQYPQGGSGSEAYDRFSKVMVRLLAVRASHPIYGSDRVLESPGGWDRVVIVRYRSRRDIADIFATDAFADASAHQWAGVSANERLLAQSVHLPDGRIAIGVAALLAALAVWFAASRASMGALRRFRGARKG